MSSQPSSSLDPVVQSIHSLTSTTQLVRAYQSVCSKSFVTFLLSKLCYFLGDNSDKLCELCVGRVPGEKCTSGDPFAGYEGAFKCLRERGDIAFLKHTTVTEMTSTMSDLS